MSGAITYRQMDGLNANYSSDMDTINYIQVNSDDLDGGARGLYCHLSFSLY